MPEFSACYFCGTALDAPLAEYPVVPDALHPAADQQRTVVLCPTCRRKLGAVVDTVVEAVDDAPEADSIQQGLVESRENGSHTTADDANATAERLDAGDAVGSDALETADAGEPDAEGASASSAETGDDDSGFDSDDELEQDSTATARASDTESTAASDADTAVNDPEPDARAATESDAGAADDAGEGAATAGDAPKSDDSGAGTAEDEPRMTALEYNKVMRLLQNREFPVDKAEFEVVATNAYDIEDDEFDAVIEAAEKRDLIAVENGQIVDG